jgi:RHS repeat-associated protein
VYSAYFSASAIPTRIATRVDGTLYYVHSDLLGSTVALSDAAGQAVGRVQYDPYGEVITSTLPVTLTDRLFTGQRLDSSTGLYYYNARYYDPHLGRFIQPDTLVPDPLNPQAWNRFSYVYNNPTSYVDPSGHDGILVPLRIFGGAFLIGAGAGGYYAYHQGYGFESWQLYAYAGMGGLAGVAGAATGMWIEAALLPMGATVWQAAAAGAAGGFAAGVVEQSILEAGGAAILGTEVSAERILLAGVTGGVTGGIAGGVSRWWRLRAATDAGAVSAGKTTGISPEAQNYLQALRNEGQVVAPRGSMSARIMGEISAGARAEVGLFRLRTGERILVMGGPGSVAIPPGTQRIIAHTHPSGILQFSEADIAALAARGQRSSVLINLLGQASRLRVPY